MADADDDRSRTGEQQRNDSFVPRELVPPMQAAESVAMQTILKRHSSPLKERGDGSGAYNGAAVESRSPMSDGSSQGSPSRAFAPEIGSSLASAFQTMKNGTLLKKFCRSGPPHMRHFYINASKTKLKWKSQKKKPAKTEISVGDMIKLEEGQVSDNFVKNSKNTTLGENHCSFSVYYRSKGKETVRTLDVVCKDAKIYAQWVQGIKWLIIHKDELLDHFLHEKHKDEEHDQNVLYSSSDVYTLGSNNWGQLGHTEDINEIVSTNIPTRIRYFIEKNVTNICAIDVGDAHMVAATTSGDVYAWGHSGSNRLGQLERHGEVFNHFLVPKPIDFFKNPDLEVTQIACGACHTLFLTSTGTVYTAGSNAMGQLGFGSKAETASVVKALVPTTVKYIAAGNMTSAAISSSFINYIHKTVTEKEYINLGVENNQRLLYTWGCNLWGATGQGKGKEPCYNPTEVLNAAILRGDQNSYKANYSCLSIDFGDFHAAAVVECMDTPNSTSNELEKVGNRYLMTWGSNAHGQLGHDFTSVKSTNSPQIVTYFHENHFKPVSVSCGAGHTSLLSLDIGNEGYDHSPINDNYSTTCFHTWGLAKACTFFEAEPPTSKFITTPQQVNKSKFYQVKGGTQTPLRRATMIQGLLNAASRTSLSDATDDEEGGNAGPDAISDDFKSIACGNLFTYVSMVSGQTFLLGQPIPSGSKSPPNYKNKEIVTIAAGGSSVAFIARRKWIADKDAIACTKCNSEFTTLRRRHHCRNCGGLFCNDCSSGRAVLLKYGFDNEVRRMA